MCSVFSCKLNKRGDSGTWILWRTLLVCLENYIALSLFEERVYGIKEFVITLYDKGHDDLWMYHEFIMN